MLYKNRLPPGVESGHTGIECIKTDYGPPAMLIYVRCKEFWGSRTWVDPIPPRWVRYTRSSKKLISQYGSCCDVISLLMKGTWYPVRIDLNAYWTGWVMHIEWRGYAYWAFQGWTGQVAVGCDSSPQKLASRIINRQAAHHINLYYISVHFCRHHLWSLIPASSVTESI